MLKKMLIAGVALGLLGAGCISAPPPSEEPSTQFVDATGRQYYWQEVKVFIPAVAITSGFVLNGEAVGGWYSEAVFPVKILDASGNEIGAVQAHAASDQWQTSDFSPFTVTLVFTPQPAGTHGTVVFHNDNPSGDPARDKEYSAPITFGN